MCPIGMKTMDRVQGLGSGRDEGSERLRNRATVSIELDSEKSRVNGDSEKRSEQNRRYTYNVKYIIRRKKEENEKKSKLEKQNTK